MSRSTTSAAAASCSVAASTASTSSRPAQPCRSSSRSAAGCCGRRAATAGTAAGWACKPLAGCLPSRLPDGLNCRPSMGCGWAGPAAEARLPHDALRCCWRSGRRAGALGAAFAPAPCCCAFGNANTVPPVSKEQLLQLYSGGDGGGGGERQRQRAAAAGLTCRSSASAAMSRDAALRTAASMEASERAGNSSASCSTSPSRPGIRSGPKEHAVEVMGDLRHVPSRALWCRLAYGASCRRRLPGATPRGGGGSAAASTGCAVLKRARRSSGETPVLSSARSWAH